MAQRTRMNYTQKQKDEAFELIDGGMSIPKVAEKLGIAEMTLANWKKYRAEKQAEAEERTAQQQLEDMKFKLDHVLLTNKYLKKLARAENDSDKKDIEIDYLRERLRKLFGDVWVKPLAELDDEEDDETETGAKTED